MYSFINMNKTHCTTTITKQFVGLFKKKCMIVISITLGKTMSTLKLDSVEQQ